jgi:hypothetical protein
LEAASVTRGEGFSVSFLLLILAGLFGFAMTSSNRYFEVTRFEVLDTICGTSPIVKYDRIIKRDFPARWKVDLYRDGVYVATARSRGVHTYRTLAVLPDAIDLDWLTIGDPNFTDLQPSRYTIAIEWDIYPDLMWLRRQVEARDDFEVFCQ